MSTPEGEQSAAVHHTQPVNPITSPPEIEIRDFNFFYGTFQSLDPIALTIPQRRITALIGASGSGKSTLLRAINCSPSKPRKGFEPMRLEPVRVAARTPEPPLRATPARGRAGFSRREDSLPPP